MISKTTCILLDASPEVHDIKESIERPEQNMNGASKRQAIQDIWKKNFSAETNYRVFLQYLIQIKFQSLANGLSNLIKKDRFNC